MWRPETATGTRQSGLDDVEAPFFIRPRGGRREMGNVSRWLGSSSGAGRGVDAAESSTEPVDMPPVVNRVGVVRLRCGCFTVSLLPLLRTRSTGFTACASEVAPSPTATGFRIF
jgi:hypothetical protein